ncbi:MAG: hypothetical protein COA90_00765 [Gammaproteobacteria bacterium]|nr:MAG: hypothetical protein COA90_00765 [Gammaproteobacteria bacterium]
MIVPQYWSESKLKKIVNGKQFTLKRFGWSDVSELDAKVHADERLKEAEQNLDSDGDIRRIDHKVPYNGAEGIPIREEIISRHQDNVITRNSYGALCINTPNVLFADVDIQYTPSYKIYLLAAVLLIAITSVVAFLLSSWTAFILGALATLFFTASLASRLDRSIKDDPEDLALQTIKQVAQADPSLNLRVYRTPMGFRVLVMNSIFDPRQESTIELLNSFNSDRLYTQMCKNQNCFRARVSPKPWRINIDRLKPTPGTWPIKYKHMANRQQWVEHYNKASEAYSSYHFIMQLGSNTVVPETEYVRELHDSYSKVNLNNLDLA